MTSAANAAPAPSSALRIPGYRTFLSTFMFPQAEEARAGREAAARKERMKQRTPRVDWAEWLKRTFDFDLFACVRCGGCAAYPHAWLTARAASVSGPPRHLRSNPHPQHGLYPAFCEAAPRVKHLRLFVLVVLRRHVTLAPADAAAPRAASAAEGRSAGV